MTRDECIEDECEYFDECYNPKPKEVKEDG